MPWSPRNLSSLFQLGIYINDFPGLQLDNQDLHYFYGHFPLKTEEKSPPVQELEKAIEKWLKLQDITVFKVFYWDHQGHALFLTPQVPPPLPKIHFRGKDRPLDALENLILFREYSAEGAHGTKNVQYEEKKPVPLAIEKFLGTYMRGWRGLFLGRLKNDRHSLFESFSPHKTLGFIGEGCLYNAHLRFFLNKEVSLQSKHFQQVTLTIPQVDWEDLENLP